MNTNIYVYVYSYIIYMCMYRYLSMVVLKYPTLPRSIRALQKKKRGQQACTNLGGGRCVERPP